jgi:uncharacterized protein
VRQTTLGTTGRQVSMLGCGTMWFADMSQAETNAALNHALDRGVDYIDSARSYGDAEIKVGEAIGHRHDEFFLATKTDERSREAAAAQIDESLARLQVDYLDLIQLHYVNYQYEFEQLMGKGGALEAAVAARAAGKVRFIGISGHRPELLATWLAEYEFDTVLFHLNPIQPFAASELLPIATAREVGTIAMRPVGSGAVQDAPRSLRFVRSQGVDVVLSGLTTPDIVDANIAALDDPIAGDENQELTAWVASIGNNGCRRCNYCSCPVGIEVPDMLLTEPLHARGAFSDAGRATWNEATAAVHKCEGHEPCRTAPICESACPYDLPIRSTALRLAGGAQ